MRIFPMSACFAVILAIITPQNSIAGGKEYDECVEFGITWCRENNDPIDVNFSLCILRQVALCDKLHGGGGGGDPVANHFTAEQQGKFDALVRDIGALRRENARVKDELTKFFIELRSDAYRQDTKQGLPAK